MDKRLDASRSGYHKLEAQSHTKKSKKKSNKKSNVSGSWINNIPNDHNNDMMPGMEYQHVMWPPGMQQNFANNGRRLFTAASDPSVCGYTPMPVTYAMEPVSLPPMYRLYPSVPLSGMKPVHPGIRRQCHQNATANMGFNVSSMANGYTSLQENGSDSPMHGHYQNGDYTSLPPTANKNHGINGDELSSEHRRYSDPGLGSAEAPDHTQSDDSDTEDSGSSTTTVGRNNKLVLSLIEQMTELKKSNSQLFKDLSETKSELENVKAKLVQCKHSASSDYQPGMLSDLIHEIREANKSCEESLITKVRAIVEEKVNQKSSEVEKLNSQLMKLTKEKEESDRRVAKLEEEVATLKMNANNEGREIAAFEEETLALRRELQEARASRTLAENHAANTMPVTAVTGNLSTYDDKSTSRTTAVSPLPPMLPLSSLPPLPLSPTDCEDRRFPECVATDQQNPSSSASQECHSSEEDKSKSLVDSSSEQEKNEATNIYENVQEMNETIDKLAMEALELCASNSNATRDARENKVEQEKGVDCSGTVSSSVPEPGPNTLEGGFRLSTSNAIEKKTVETKELAPKGVVKKPRRKRNSGTAKRSYSDADRPTRKTEWPEDGTQASVSANDSSFALKDNFRRTVSEDEDCLDDDQASRAITEIPEVAVVGGGSFVPKDLCSAGILTSRVLTAPSRATYTTAYI